MKWFCEAESKPARLIECPHGVVAWRSPRMPVRKRVKLCLTQSLLSQAVFGLNDPNQGSFNWLMEEGNRVLVAAPRSGSAKQKTSLHG